MPIKEFADFILGSIAALFPVIDPIGSVPIFLVLTAGVPESLRRILRSADCPECDFLAGGLFASGRHAAAIFWGFAGSGADCGRNCGVPCGLEYDERGVKGERARKSGCD